MTLTLTGAYTGLHDYFAAHGLNPWPVEINGNEWRFTFATQEEYELATSLLDSFPPAPTIAEQVQVLWNVYDRTRKQMERQLSDAVNFYKDPAYAQSIWDDIKALDDQYNDDVEAVYNG